MPPPATLLQSHDTSYMLKRGWASEKSSQPTSCIHLHTFIILHKLVPQKTFDSLIAYLRLIPVYGSSWMYKIFKKNSSVVLSFPPTHSSTLVSIFCLSLVSFQSRLLLKMLLKPCSYLFLQIMISLHHAMSSVRYIMADNPGK